MIDPVDWKVAGAASLNTIIFLKFIEDAKKRVSS
jgi:hypothetical protein